MNFINFADHIKYEEAFNSYGGSERKKGVVLDDGYPYILKFPDPSRNKNTDVSYINNVLSEYIGCKIVQSMGIPVQEVVLGFYESNGKIKLAVACKNLCYEYGQDCKLAEAANIMLGDEQSPRRKTILLSDIDDFINRFPEPLASEALSFYYKQFVADALIGNTDRHNGNWGLLQYNNNQYTVCPVFDCGSSFDSLLSDEQITEDTTRRSALSVHSALSDENGRISYAAFFKTTTKPEFVCALRSLAYHIDTRKMHAIVNDIPDDMISDSRRRFYNDVIETRYTEMFVPAFARLLSAPLPDKNILIPNDVYKKSENLAEYLKVCDIGDATSTIVDDQSVHIRKASNKFALLYNDETGQTCCAPFATEHNAVTKFAYTMMYCANAEDQAIIDQHKVINTKSQNSDLDF